MNVENCGNCIDERKVQCDAIREKVTEDLALLLKYQNLCHGFGFVQPATVTESAQDLRNIGCDLETRELLELLNPDQIS